MSEKEDLDVYPTSTYLGNEEERFQGNLSDPEHQGQESCSKLLQQVTKGVARSDQQNFRN